MPLVNKTFDQLLDFTRTSAATFINSEGRIQTTAASRNLLTYTQEFDNAAWAKSGVTVTANTTVAPDGTSTADTLTASAGASTHRFIGPAVTIAVGNSCTHSIYVKAGTHNFVQIHDGASAIYFANFNLTTGAVGTSANCTATITDVGNGWYRCAMIFTVAAANPVIGVCLVSSASAARNESWTATGTETVFVWGAQLEAVPAANLTLGTELVTNGTFAGGSTTGWTAGGSATISGTGDVLTITNGATAYGYAVTPIATVVGRTYYVTYQVTGGTNNGSLYIGTASGGFEIYNGPGVGVGSYAVSFVATTTTTYLRLGPLVNTSGATFIVDNISTKEVTAITGMPSTYTRNIGGVFPPRFEYDPVTLAPKGLLMEEQRTNLALQSDLLTTPTWTGVRIDRTTNGNYARLTANETNANGGFFTYTPSALAASTYTTSVQVSKTSANKFILRPTNPLNAASVASVGVDPATGVATTPSASVDFSNPSVKVEDMGSDWRVSLTFTTLNTIQVQMRLFVVDSTSGLPVTLGANIDVRYAQFEAGAFATSYIPTVASQVTRTADICTIVAPNFAPWYNQSEGSFVSEFSFFASNDTVNPKAYFAVSDGTSSNRIYGNLNASNVPFVFVSAGGVTQANMSTGTALTNNAVAKVATAYKTNDFAAVLNAGTVATDTSATVPTVNMLSIANNFSFNQLNGHVRSIRYYPTRLTNAQLQALTA